MAAPARRALERKGISPLEKLSNLSEKEIVALHGMGKSTLPILKKTLEAEGLRFRAET